jgi:hypothetical protein
MDKPARKEWSLQCAACGRVFDCLPEDLHVYLRTDWPKCCYTPMRPYLGSYLVRRSSVAFLIVAQLTPAPAPDAFDDNLPESRPAS